MRYNAKKQWDIVKKKGRIKYIFPWVLFLGIVLPIIDKLFDLLKGNFTSMHDLILELALQILVYSVISYFFAKLSWTNLEKKALAEDKNEYLKNLKVNFCYFCGTELTEKSSECPSCGRQLEL